MTNAMGPNEVRLTGENPFVRLQADEDSEPTTHASYWRVLLSPAGAGHALFLRSELTDDEPRIYADNIALARWLQEEIEGSMRDTYSDLDLPVIDASFSKSGDARSYWTESVESDEDSVDLTWYDFGEPYVVSMAPGARPGQVHGVYSCLVPARRAQVTINGQVAKGGPFPRDQEGTVSSTCCLAFSETWVRPRTD